MQPAGAGARLRRARMSGARVLVAAFGDPGHAYPAIALARALAGRGNEVLVETWEHWREAVESAGLAFTAAQEYTTFPPPPPGSDDDPSAADAAMALLPLMEEERFDVVVSDILTQAPALAAERAGLRRATLIPHVYPVHEPGLPFFAFGSLPARTPVGRALWRGCAAGAGRRARAGARRVQRVARALSGWRRPSGCTAGSPSSWRWLRPSRSSSIRGAGRSTST